MSKRTPINSMGHDRETPQRTSGKERLPSLILMEWQQRDLAKAKADQARHERDIVAEARWQQKIRPDAWAESVARGPYAAGHDKCNLFVYDVLNAAGTPVPMFERSSLKYYGAKVPHPPVANEWADPDVTIAGWEVVENPRAGDVVALKSEGGSGHVGIVIEPGRTISVESKSGMLKVKDFGFVGKDALNGYVFRRYVGTSAK